MTARLRGATSGTSLLLPSWTCAVPTLAPGWNRGLAVQALKPHSISRVDSCTRAFQLRQPGEHLDQPPPVLLGRAGEAVAGLVGMAGLEPVGARDMAEDRVAVLLRDVLPRAQCLSPGEARQRIEFLVEFRVMLDLARARVARSRAVT